jgi:predicted DNA-binding protein
MNTPPGTITCSDPTQPITIQLPCRLAERVDKYARETGNTITGVVIEALDALLRGRKVD